jgi:hypothetical protein
MSKMSYDFSWSWSAVQSHDHKKNPKVEHDFWHDYLKQNNSELDYDIVFVVTFP